MRRFLYVVAILIAVITFSCDTTSSSFDEAVPELYTLTTSVSPAGSGSVQPSGGEYVDGTGIEILAIPENGYVFDRWDGDLSGSTNPDSLFFTRNRNVTAIFVERDYPLTVTVVGEGSVREEVIDRSEKQDPNQNNLSPSDSKVQPDPQGDRTNRKPDPEGDPIDSEIVTQRVETVTTQSSQLAVTTVRLTAEPEEGWFFDRWEGDLTGSENPAEIEVDDEEAKAVTAVFEQEEVQEFTLSVNTDGDGTVDADPDQSSYLEGEEVTLTATPASGWDFIEWQEDLSGSVNPETIVMDQDKTITARFELPGASVMNITRQPTETTAGTPISPAPEIVLTDDQGNPLSGVNISVSLNNNNFTSGSSTTAVTNSEGAAEFSDLIIETAATGYTLIFDADEQGVSNVTSNPFDVTAGAADPANSGAVVPDGVAGEQTSITITVLDEFDNPVSGQAENLSVEVVSGDNTGASFEAITDEGNGVYTTGYTPTSSGSDQIEILLGSTAITGSPFTSSIITSSVSSANSSVTANPTQLEVGNSSELTITLRDNQNNAVSGIEGDIQISGLGSATAGAITENGTTGVYNANISSTTAGSITVSVTADGVSLSQNPEITFLAGDADEIVIQSGNNQTGTVTQPLDNPFTVRVTDQFGNSVEGENVTFEITQTPAAALGQSLSEESVNTNSDGEASSTLTLGTTPGTYEVTTTAGVAGEVTFTATAELGAVSNLSVLLQPSETVAGSGISPAPQVEVTDAGGNPVEGVEVSVTEQGGYLFDSGTLTVTSNSSGIAEFDDLVIQTAGNYTLVFSTDESGVDDIASDPFNVIAAAADPSNTTASVPDGAAGEPTTITITVQDTFDNPVSGVAGDLSVTVTGGNSASPSVNETGTTGEYTATYTPQNAGADDISIELLGTPIQGSPFTSDVTVSDISASVSTVTATPSELVVDNASAVTVELRDGSNNPIGGLNSADFSIDVSGDASAGSISESVSGTYEFNVNNTTAQQVTVTVTAQGVTLDDTPAITFVAGTATQITITSQPAETVAGEPVAGSPAILLRDSFNNPVPDIEVTISEQGGQEFAEGDFTVTTNSSGIAAFENAVITDAGRYNIVFTAAGGLVITSNAFDVIPAAADPASTTASVPNGAAGDVTNITITVSDEFGNRVSGEAGNLSVTVSGANAGAAVSTITDDGNGVYTTGYTPQSTGTDQISIELNGIAIPGSPYESNVITSDADAVEVTTQPQETVAGQVIVGPPSVLVTDNLDNPVEGVEVVVSLQDGSFASGTTTLLTDASGIAEFDDLIVNESGNYSLEFNAIGVTDNAVSDAFDVVPAAASSINLVSGNSQSGVVTETLSEPFVVRVTDSFGNSVQNETVEFEITNTPAGASGETLSQEIVQTEASGEASSVLTLGTIAGSYTVAAALSGVGSVSFTANAAAGTATDFEFNTIASPQTAGQAFSITIEATDSQGNIATGYSGSAGLSTTAGTITPTSATFSSGQVTLDVTVSEAGTDQTITATDGAITGTSKTFDVQSGGVDADNSTVTADPATLQAGSPSTVTVDLRDGSNNPVSGLTDTDFTIGLTGSATAGTVSETATDGTYSFAVNNNVAESVTVTVAASGVTLTDSPSITFTAADANLANTVADVPSGIAGNTTIITITLEDEFRNPVSGAAGQLEVTVSGANSDTPAVSESGTPGEYTSSYTPTSTGTDNIVITLNGSQIPGSPFASEVTTSDISASVSTVTANPTTLQAGSSSTITIELRDGSNNPIGGLDNSDFTINESGDAISGTVSEISAGTYQFTVQNETAEIVTVTVTADGVTLDDTPDITFEAGDVDIVAIQTQPGETVAGEPITGPPLVRLLDQFNNRVPGVEITVSEQSDQSFASGTLTLTSNSSGEATFSDLVINEADSYNLVFTASGQVGSTVAFDVIPAAPEASATTASVPNGSAGDQTDITITVEDEFGNRVTGEADNLSVSVSGANDGATVDPISDDGNGIYTTGYTPTSTGTDEIAITLSGVAIAGSPYTSNVITSDAENVSVDTQPQETIAGQPITGPPAALVTDNLANAVSGVEVIAGLQSGNFDGGTTSVNSDGSGIATFSDLVINTAGAYIMEFNAVGVSEDAVSQEFDVIPAAASQTVSVSGDNQTGTVAADLTEPFVIRVEDTFGNPVSGHTVEFAVDETPADASDQALSTTNTTTDVSGEASTQLTLGDRPGTYTVNADAGVAGLVVFTATAEPGAADSFAISTISTPQTAGQPFSLTIEALDEFENRATGYSGSAGLSTTAGAITPATATFSSGQVTLDVTVSEAGTDQTITATDGTVTGTSNTFDVQSGGVDADNSTVTADPINLETGNLSTVTIELRDGSNNPVSGLTDTDFTIGLTGSATDGTVTEGTAGTYSFSVNNTVAESVTVTVAADGVTLTDSPTITFTAAAAASLDIQSGNNQTGTVSEALADPFVVQITDQYGNPVEGETVDFAIDQVPAGASGQSVSQTSVLTNAAGEASTLLTLGDTPGTYTVDASSGSLTTVTFSAEAEIGTASQMTVSVQPGETTAGEDITPSPAVTVTDDVGNGVEGISVTVSERGGYTFDGGTLTVSTDASGNASFTDLMIETANTYQLVFNADAAGVPNASSVEFNVTAAAGVPANTTADVPNGAAGEPTDITITVRDSFNNPVTGIEGDLSVSVTSGPNSGFTFTSIVDNGDGTYSTSYTPEIIGTDDITITLNTTEISGSPYPSNVTNSEVSASNSTVTANPETLQAGINSEVTVEVRDGSDNPISGLVSGDFNINVSNSGTAGTITETATGGTYTFDVANTVAEEVTVTVTATGTTLDNTPVINFTAADPDQMVITTEPETSVAGQPIEGPPAVRIDDEFGNPVPEISVTVTELDETSFSTGSTTTVDTDAFGFATFGDLSIETAGQHNLVFSATGGFERTSNAFNVDPAAVSASVSSATATSPHTADGSDASTVTVTLTDGFGNEISGLVDGNFAVDVGANATAGTVSETATDGTYTFTVTNTSVETVTVVITAAGVTLDDQPAIEFQAGAASEMSVSTQPTATTAGTAISPAPAVEVTDGTNPVSGVNVTAILSSNDFTATSTVVVTTDASGIAEFGNLVIETAGTGYTIIFDADAAGVANVDSDPFDVTAASAAALNEVSGTGQSAQINQTLSSPFVVEVVDGFGNPVSGETVGFNIVATPTDAAGQSLSAASVVTGANGQAASTLTLGDKVGTYGMDADWSTSTVSFTANAESGDASAMSVSTQPETTTAGAAIPGPPAVTVVDAGGNPVSGVNVTVSEQGGYLFDGGTLTVATDASGIATFSDLVIQTADTYTLVFSAAGLADITSNTFDVNAGAAETVSAQTVQGTAAADGTDDLEYQVTIEDANQNPVSGVSVVASDDGTDITYPSGTTLSTDVNGQVSFTATSLTVQSGVTFTFTEQDNSNNTTALGSFEDSSGFTVADPGGQTAGEEFTLEISDASGVDGELLEGNMNVAVSSDIDGQVHDALVSFSGGSATVPVILTTAEDHTLTMNVDGVSDDETIAVTVTAGAAGQVSSLTIADSEIALDGTTSVTATILDANANPVPDVTVSFASDQETRATVDPTATTGANGQATATVNGAGDEAGEVIITASISDTDANVETSDSETIGLTVLTGSADSGQSDIGADPLSGLTANGTDASTLTITVRDGGGNLLESEDVFFEITGGTGGTLSAGPWTTDAAGQATATLTSVDANVITVTGYLGTDNTGLSVGTVDVDFEAGAPVTVTATGIQDAAAADGVDELEYLVTVEDANDNSVSGVTVTASDNGSGITYTGGGSSQATDLNGQTTFTATSTTVQADVIFTFTELVNSNDDTATGSFTDGSGFTVADPGGQTAGQEFNLGISDASGVDGELLEGSINVTVTSDLDGAVHNAAVTFTGGAANVPVTLNTAADHLLTVDVDGVTDNESITVTVTAADASEMSITQQPTSTTAGEAIAPAPAVEVTDGTNPVSGVNVTAILSSNDFTATSTVVATTDAGGIAEFGNLVIEAAATGYTITFDADAAGVADVASASFDLTAAAASALNEVSGSGQSAPINQTLSSPFVVEVVDGFGNPVSGETVGFSIEATPTDAAGQSLSATSVVTGANGQAASTLTLGDKVGTYGVDADWSTFTVNFTADAESGDADAANSEIGADPASGLTANGSNASTLTITVRDGGGNLLEGEPVFFEITGGTGGTLSAGPWTTDAAGQATATLTSVDANTITVTGYLGVDNTGSTVGIAEVDFVAGPVSASESTVEANPTTLLTGETSTVTITLVDANGNPIEGLIETDFVIDLGGSSATSNNFTVTATPGVYTVDVSNAVAETVTVTITADEVSLDDQPTIVFE